MATLTQPHKTRHAKKSAVPKTALGPGAATTVETLPLDQAQYGEVVALRIWLACVLLLWLMALAPFLTGVWR
jgi:hypothetical protein